ncbi:hypothetical protein A2480_02815 [Candidatus Uhrbacteria bacterium RIFOXYC2_FULL_47_19]|uniref:GyrI-like small molecule binding domain-containing protein n=1 Tax=Candidatus Uhrbacteria bacterium RIFOXYC2_FULL_47_19 TaxID=1802424 RepID=A0A1F7WE63_9BACT|nr:MAG: hypothetical protein A2480_02815 [Candidatus Uhrbacteria bacterium RIFOXYC2_FULL_47_19]HCC22265.1 hypothetical protein [Candidatus Uhrbacteria bacterium]
MNNQTNGEGVGQGDECCPRFDPSLWDEKEVTWSNKPFLREKVRSFLHMPINMGAVFKRGFDRLERAGAMPVHPIWLSDERSSWGADLLIEMDREVDGADIVRLSGVFLSKVFEGPYRNIGQWIGEMGRFVESRGQKIEKLFFYYTTCPKCAKKYGRNYVVLVAKVG